MKTLKKKSALAFFYEVAISSNFSSQFRVQMYKDYFENKKQFYFFYFFNVLFQNLNT